MKKLVFLILLFAAPCFADNGATFYGSGHGIATAGGATYIFRYNSDHASGTNYAYLNSGVSSEQASTTSGTVETSPVRQGTYSYLSDAINEKYKWSTGGGPYTALSEGSIEVYVYVNVATITGACTLFEIVGTTATNDLSRASINSNGTVYFRHEGNNSVVSMSTTGTVTPQQWVRLRFRYTVAGGSIGIQIDSASWETQAGSVGTMTDAITICVGEDVYGISQSHPVYFDGFETISGYNTFND